MAKSLVPSSLERGLSLAVCEDPAVWTETPAAGSKRHEVAPISDIAAVSLARCVGDVN